MWETIEHHFDRYPSRKKLAKCLFEYGLKVTENGTIKCGDIAIPYSKIVKSLKIDKATVSQTIKMILTDPNLKSIFMNLEPTVNLRNIANHVGYTVLEIESKTNSGAVLVEIASKMDSKNITIIQFLAYALNNGVKIIIIINKESTRPIIEALREIHDIRIANVANFMLSAETEL